MVNGILKEQGIEDIIGDRKLEEDGKYECDQCYNNYTTKSSLYLYKQSKHEGVRYECDKCEYKATFKSDLTKHKQPKHEGVIYECDQCEYKALDKDNSSKHKESCMKELGMDVGMNVTSVNGKLIQLII